MTKDNPANRLEVDNSPTRISLMRHAPTPWNLEQRIQGNVNIDIVPEEIAPYFQRMNVASLQKPDLLIVSELDRTYQTARALLDFRHWEGIPIIKDHHFNEKKWGILEGKTNQDAKKLLLANEVVVRQYPDLEEAPEMEPIWEDDNFQVEGGESINQVRQRVLAGLELVGEQFWGKNILVIAHLGVLQSLRLPTSEVARFDLVKNQEGKYEITNPYT